MKRDKINSIICDSIDSSLKNINNIVDTIPLDENGNISFTTVAFINGIEWDVNKFDLHYFIENLDINKTAYLGGIEFENDKKAKKRSNGSSEKGSHVNSSQSIADMRFDDVNIPGEGAYELQVFKYENDEVVDLSVKRAEERIKYVNDEHLVAAYSFEVIKAENV